METWLFEVEEVLALTGLGPILIPGLKPTASNIKVGDEVILLQPDGEELRTRVKGFPMINYQKLKDKGCLAIEIGNPKETRNIPVGTQVFLVRDGELIRDQEWNKN